MRRSRIVKPAAYDLQARQILSKTPLKVTRVRVAILALLMKEHGPFSIEEIHAEVGESDLTTVYRNLSAMEELKLVKRLNLGDALARFEFIHEATDHHHHIICTICRKIESIAECIVKELDLKISRRGYSNVKHSLEFSGVCRMCR